MMQNVHNAYRRGLGVIVEILAVLLIGNACLAAATYHVDSRFGNDTNDGLSFTNAWRTLEKVNGARFAPGNSVSFRRGSVWPGQLRITSSGTSKKPIAFQAYGIGSRPRIDAAGAFSATVVLSNAQHVVLSDFELTNRGEGDQTRTGVNVLADNCGTLTNVVITGLFIHDVNGTQRRKDNGGIIFRTLGQRVASRYDGLRIERNIIWRVDRSGIAAQSYHSSRTRWFPSTNVLIRDNWVGDVGGDGIVPWATDGCVVEHNVVQGANERAGTYNAGIWPWSTDNTVLRLNRASAVKTLMDGQGFDSDFNSRNTVIEFNLSHDNEGGFVLICSPGKRNQRENIGNVGTIVRNNISRHDRARTIHLSAAEGTLVHDNAIYIRRGDDVQALLLTDWSGWPKGLEVRNNLFHSEGLARYGHQTGRAPDGSYAIGPGWGPAEDITFRGNRFAGRHEGRPADNGPDTSAPAAMDFADWPGPAFDPQKPDEFNSYMDEHRRWMLALMKRQFGRLPQVAGTPE